MIAVSQTLGNPGRAGSFGVESVPLPLGPPPRKAEPDLGVNRRAVRSPITLCEQPQYVEPRPARPRVTWRQAIRTIEQLLGEGVTDAPTIGKRFGVSVDLLYLSLHRYERIDLWKQMTNRTRKPSIATGAQASWAKAIPRIEQLLGQGTTDTATIADHLGIRPAGIYSGLRRYRRLDLWERMTHRWASRSPQG